MDMIYPLVLSIYAFMSLRAEETNCTIEMCAGKILCSEEQCVHSRSYELSSTINGEVVCCDRNKFVSFGLTMDPDTEEHLCFCEENASNSTTDDQDGYPFSPLGSVLNRPLHLGNLLTNLINL